MPRFESVFDMIDGYEDKRTREAAIMLVLAQTGTELEPQVLDNVVNGLADAAETHDLSPDEVQTVLEWHEPTLRAKDSEDTEE